MNGRDTFKKKGQLESVESASLVREENNFYRSFRLKETKKITSTQKGWPGGPIARVERDAHAAQKPQLT